jgi:A/G-specific adenine glycosylase
MIKSGDCQRDRQNIFSTMKKIAKTGPRFSRLLLKWNSEKNNRQLPWKGEKDPYKIWLSEIILQQTRVEQGLNYYKKFIDRFPDVHQLAAAKDTVIYKMWEGLGYYNRCKNLIETARNISKKRNGKFPETYDEILALKGVGNYTAAAIASFAFNLPYAVVDGNVYRVLSRVFGINKPTDSISGKKYFTELADELLDKQNPGLYNQALMDFGAVICKPLNPLCHACVFQKHCYAFRNKATDVLPVKENKLKFKQRWFYFIVAVYRGRVYLRLRSGNDIWRNLHEFILVETASARSADDVLNEAAKMKWLKKRTYNTESVSPVYRQTLSHQKIACRFIRVKLKRAARVPGYKAVMYKQLARYAFPKIINEFLRYNPVHSS